MEFKKIEFIKKINEYGDVYSFYFKNNGIIFEAGQFCHLLIEEGDQREVRDMSFASIPSDDFLMFTMHVDSGSFFKKSLMNLNEGDTISLFKIVGKLKINTSSFQKHIFISGGVGLTPFRSIIKSNLLPKKDMEVLQVQRENHLYKNELEPLVNKYHAIAPDNFENSIKNIITSNPSANFYICGSKRFIEGVTKITNDLSVVETQIQIEGFYKDKK